MASTTPQSGRRWLSRQPQLNQEEIPPTAGTSQSQDSDANSDAPSEASDIPSYLKKRRLISTRSTEATSSSPQATSTAASSHPTSPPPLEVRTCWICQQDDTEDTAENNVWRTPCPCSLTAHDSCLLEWIANEEAPKPGELAQNRRIVCPQCQAQINIQRPRDYLVAAVENVQWVAKRLMLPAAVSATIGCGYAGLLVYGVNAMTLVFGVEESKNILMNGFHREATGSLADFQRTFRTMMQLMDPFFPVTPNSNPTLYFAVPLIGPALVLLRTRFADQALAILIPLYLLKPSHRTISWPPSPGLTLATIPYIRSLYNEIYRNTLSPLEKKWDLAVQRTPREGETAEQIAAAAQEAAADDGPHAVFELEWREEVVDVPVEEEMPFRAARAAPENPDTNFVIDGQENEGVAPQPNPPRPNPQNNNHNHGNNNVAIQQDIDIPALASTVLGALFFPAVSSLMGSLLKHTLPTSLTTPTVISKGFFRTEVVTKGLLKEKWGRSIIGGCLFVVLKDAVVLYCKWKKAKDFGKRKVLDFVGERGRNAN